jgi:hypothetical protein
MKLPGGILRSGEVRRQFRFRELDGALELGVAELAGRDTPLPRRVSRVLAAVLEQVGGEPVDEALAGQLCVADRQFLMRGLERLLGRERPWRAVMCGACHERFDFELRASELPVKEAGEGFPFVQVDTGQGRVRVRVPTGADQEALLEAPLADVRGLLARCVETPGFEVARLEEEDVQRIDAALEAVAPAVVTRVWAVCAACGAGQEVEVDPYTCLSLSPEALLEEVHTLASVYHWSERDILALPRHRRRQYLRLVERTAGVTASTDVG